MSIYNVPGRGLCGALIDDVSKNILATECKLCDKIVSGASTGVVIYLLVAGIETAQTVETEEALAVNLKGVGSACELTAKPMRCLLRKADIPCKRKFLRRLCLYIHRREASAVR